MTSLVSRSDSSSLLAFVILKLSGVLIPSIQYVVIERCHLPRAFMSCRADILQFVVAGFVTRLECVIPCGGEYVEYMLL
ncbi:hypothetical protein TNCV_401361 [Trichonephila clavipes]|nr:hypothetical protein TNCV_401361 [Trichonephila clavipes]